MKSPVVFNGHALAGKKELAVAQAVERLAQEARPHVAAILFTEDEGSVLYSNLKREAAERVGIQYTLHEAAISESTEQIIQIIRDCNEDPAITGIIIQKPRRSIWQKAARVEGGDPKAIKSAFNTWWELLTAQIDPAKDVDGLHPETHAAIVRGTWNEEGKVLPATAKAVVSVLFEAARELGWGTQGPKVNNASNAAYTGNAGNLGLALKGKHVAILGKSDLLGKPLYALLQSFAENYDITVSLYGRPELERARSQGKFLHDADIVVSATGVVGLITQEDVRDGVVLIDVGEPRPDIDTVSDQSVLSKAAFISPVPGGVGPVTVVSLLENAIVLAAK